MPYKDKAKQKEAQHKHYKNNKNKFRARVRKRRQENFAWLYENVLKGKRCKCGEDHPATFDFHHRDPKNKIATISRMMRDGRSREMILEEIKKCDLMCANCHRKHHRDEIK